ncbi:MAG: multisubunit Na+/H+ antiporter MnhB subunit [Gammaproteobacteria bacterium]|jgi:multisubunit Na+/H+ antiporter MnhB subunit
MSSDYIALTFDMLLASMAVGLAAMSVFARQLITAIASFIALGLVLAIAWARLGALDLALAEVILGPGILGGLLLRAWSNCSSVDATRDDESPMRYGLCIRAMVGFLALAMGVLLFLVGRASEHSVSGMPEQFAARIESTGVSHPVTAILLDFRALDTLLELAVLLVATLAVLSLAKVELKPRTPVRPLAGLLRIIVPILILTSGVLLWRGAFAPGGAFQAGACLGAAAILVLLGWQRMPIGGARAYLVLAAGVSLFSLLGAGALLFSDSLLDWPDSYAGAIILAVEIAATVSIAAALTILFAGGETGADSRLRS